MDESVIVFDGEVIIIRHDGKTNKIKGDQMGKNRNQSTYEKRAESTKKKFTGYKKTDKKYGKR